MVLRYAHLAPEHLAEYASRITDSAHFTHTKTQMVHSFNPSPFLITCHNSRLHLQDAEGIIMLNAEDFYADVVIASRGYFSALYENPIGGNRLQENFGVRVSQNDGGRPKSSKIVEHLNGNR